MMTTPNIKKKIVSTPTTLHKVLISQAPTTDESNKNRISNAVILSSISSSISYFTSTQDAVMARADKKEVSNSISSDERENSQDDSTNYGNFEQLKAELENVNKEKLDLQSQLNDSKVTNKILTSEIAQIRGILEHLTSKREKAINSYSEIECELKESNVRISTLMNEINLEKIEKGNYIIAFKKVFDKYSSISAEEVLNKELKIAETSAISPEKTERKYQTSRSSKAFRQSTRILIPPKQINILNADENALAYVFKLDNELQKLDIEMKEYDRSYNSPMTVVTPANIKKPSRVIFRPKTARPQTTKYKTKKI